MCLIPKASSLGKNMKENGDGDGYSSKSNPWERNKEEEGCDESYKYSKTSASSSNSISEESDHQKKVSSSGVRQYQRSKVPRLRWTPDLHLSFLQAVERLGGQERATPKLVLQLMNVKGLSIAHIKSHLQMYRSKKIDNQGQDGIGNHSGSADGLVPNFWHSSMLDQQIRFRSDFRFHGQSAGNFHGAVVNRRKETIITRNPEFSEQFRLVEPSFTKQWHGSGRENVNCFKNSTITGTSWSSNVDQKRNTVKRKGHDNDLDLNLSLSMKSRKEEVIKKTRWDDDEVGSNLSLSLFSCSKRESCSIDLSFPSKVMRLRDDDNKSKNPKWASTLDLTI